MKQLLLSALLLVSGAGAAWGQQMPGKSIKDYTTKLGTAIHVGDTLLLGMGRQPNGSFQYATIPPTILVPAGQPVPAYWSNKKVVVKSIREVEYRRSPNRDIRVIFKSGVFNAQLDPDAAEQVSELITARNPRPNAPAASVADEILKLKQLLDAGAITQAEYDTQKAKLLAR